MAEAPPVIKAQSGGTRLLLFAGVAMGALGLAALFFFDPARHGFFPRCFFRMITGWDCPGCGGLRATHQLLHGHLREAFVLNPLFIVALPLAVYFALRLLIERCGGRKLPLPFKSVTWLWIAAVMVAAFGILRNLPWERWLGP